MHRHAVLQQLGLQAAQWCSNISSCMLGPAACSAGSPEQAYPLAVLVLALLRASITVHTQHVPAGTQSCEQR